MQWVKVTDRLPDSDGKYIVKTIRPHPLLNGVWQDANVMYSTFTKSAKPWDVKNQLVNEWLEE